VIDVRRVALAALITALLLVGCSLNRADPRPTATPDVPTPDTPLIVAWAADGDLVVWRSGEDLPRRIASGGVIRPLLAPDGASVAYLRGPEGDPRSLWISDAAGTAERQIVDTAALAGDGETRRLSQIVWSPDGAAIYFTTLSGDSLHMGEADDLWRVDPRGGTPERLLADGDGGLIVASPDGAMLALASAGAYDTAPGTIALYVPATGERRRMLDFPAVATGSERRWHPDLRWLPDGSGLLAALPPADLVYGGGDDPATTLWSIPVDGDAQPTGRVEADFFGLPVFSADGAYVAYFARRTAPDQSTFQLMIAARDGSSPAAYAEGGLDALTLAAWLPEGDRFVYGSGAPGEWWLGQPGAEPSRFPATDTSVAGIVWADPDTYVFSARGEDGFTLSFGLLDVPVRPHEIATLETYPFFNAVLP
jgi:dipeptidyl aminopeptidase/acylaminoacyl peptidase